MVQLKEILCPVDLSETSAHALEHALALARSYTARLTVVKIAWAGPPGMVYPLGASLPPPLLMPRQLDDLDEELRRFIDRKAVAGTNINALIREGAVAPTILEEARAIGADLIVIGTHGRSGFDRLLLGSVTERILRKAECAVMTVPPADRTAAPVRGDRTIVCAVDFSPASLKAVDYALSLAQEMQATLLLAHAFDWPAARMMPSGLMIELTPSPSTWREDIKAELRALVPDEARAWCRTEELVPPAPPHEAIVKLARERDADLIVMGVHGRSTVNLALFGSTTNQVVRHASCPVVTVRD